MIGLLLLGLALFIATPYFLTANNLLNVLDQVTILGILALGMTFVIITGGIDLSVGAVLALSMMVLGWDLTQRRLAAADQHSRRDRHRRPVWLALRSRHHRRQSCLRRSPPWRCCRAIRN